MRMKEWSEWGGCDLQRLKTQERKRKRGKQNKTKHTVVPLRKEQHAEGSERKEGEGE
jgi:hypothetical protein